MEVKLFEKFNHTQILKESLEQGASELVEVFYHYDKLSYNLDLDTRIIKELYDKSSEEDFDPYSHLTEIDFIDEKKDCVLSFGDSNKKMKKLGIVYFSLPAGYTCPFADVCKSFAHKKGGKFANGKSIRDEGIYRCYSASTETIYPSTRNNRWKNLDLLKKFKTIEEKAELILKSINYYETHNKKISILRMHESGDFFTQDYFDAWMKVAEKRKDILFYGYTKAIGFLVKRKNVLPKNFRLVGSVGGTQDDILFANPDIRKAYIVETEQEARDRKLNIDINDYLAIGGQKDFALLLHGVQPVETGLNSISRDNSKKTAEKSKRFIISKEMVQSVAKKYTS